MVSYWDQLALLSNEKCLIYGLGNVGRQDDGLGIRLIEKLESISLPSFVSLESNYQLNVEDALLISAFEVVLFADASVEAEAVSPFSIRPIQPLLEMTFSTHAMSLGGVLSLCDELYGKNPRAFLLTLPGYEWEIAEELSQSASLNLELAFQFLRAQFGSELCMKSL